MNSLIKAIDGMTQTDRESISRWLPFDEEISIRTDLTEAADKAFDALKTAALSALECTFTARSEGYTAKLRRRLVETAARVYLAMGFDKLGAGESTLFVKFIIATGEWTGRKDSEIYIGEFKRPIQETLGKTEELRSQKSIDIVSRIKYRYSL
jgi:hypothetical protein